MGNVTELVGVRVDWLVDEAVDDALDEAVDDALDEARKVAVNFHWRHNSGRNILSVAEAVCR